MKQATIVSLCRAAALLMLSSVIAASLSAGAEAEPAFTAAGPPVQVAPAPPNAAATPANPYPPLNRPLTRPRLKVHCSIQCDDDPPAEPVVIGETPDAKVVVIPKE